MRNFSIRLGLRLIIMMLCLILVSGSFGARASQDDGPSTAAALDKYLADKSSPMVGEGAHYLKWGQYFNIDPRLVIAISGAESRFGENWCGNEFNVWGWKPEGECWAEFEPGLDDDTNQERFENAPGFVSGAGITMETGYEDGIFWVTENLRRNYLNQGLNTAGKVGGKWCQEGCEHWLLNVEQFMREMGGDPNNLVFPRETPVTSSVLIMPIEGLQYSKFPSDEDEPKRTVEPRSWYSVVYRGKYSGRWDTRGEGSGSHPGVDIRVDSGTPVRAIADGIVEPRISRNAQEGHNGGWGGLIILRHDDLPNTTEPVYSIYAHLREWYVNKGDVVSKGDIIGKSGGGASDPNRGKSTGSHLHFQIDRDTVDSDGVTFFTSPWFPSWSVDTPDINHVVEKYTYNPIRFIEERTQNQQYLYAYTKQHPEGWIPLQINEVLEVEIDYKNTGTETWENVGGLDNPNYIELRSVDKNGNQVDSALFHESWVDKQRIGSYLPQQKGVAPGQIARFVFKIRVNPSHFAVGDAKPVYFRPYHATGGWMPPSDWKQVSFNIQVKSEEAPIVTEVKGYHSGVWSLANSPYLVTGRVYVRDGETLTIEPGVEVRFQPDTDLMVYGVLKALGEAENRIRFTSAQSIKNPGDWNGIYLYGAEVGTTMAHCEILYAHNALTIDDSEQNVTVTNTTLRYSKESGILLDNSSPVIQTCVMEHNGGAGILANNGSTYAKIEGCTISNNGDYALRLYGDTLKNLKNLIIHDNSPNAIFVLSDSIYTGTWKNHGVPYVIAGDGTVDDGDTLTLEAGLTLKFMPETELRVNGALDAQGTEESHIRFTSLKDDSIGGDTNNDGANTSPSGGDWKGLYFYYADVGSLLSYCDVAYAKTNVIIDDSGKNVALSNCIIEKAEDTGVYIDNSEPIIDASVISLNSGAGIVGKSSGSPLVKGCFIADNKGGGVKANDGSSDIRLVETTFARNENYPVSLYGDSISQMDGVTFTDNSPNAILVLSDQIYTGIWRNHHVPYVVAGDLTVDDGDTLTLEAGVELKFQPEIWLKVYGMLKATGTDENRIQFTSYRDDAVGGDTNGDGSNTTPNEGDWNGIYFYDADAATVLTACDVTYAKNAAYIEDSRENVTLNRSTFQKSQNAGIVLENSSPLISDCEISQNGGYGILAKDGSSDARIQESRFADNKGYGLVMYGDSNKHLRNLILQNNSPNAIRVLSDQLYTGTWLNHGVPYIIGGDLTVANGNTLNLAAGTQLKFERDTNLTVYGVLKATGTLSHPIYFTSFQDDKIGGDTNQDGSSTTPQPGDWKYIRFYDADVGTLLAYCHIRYAQNAINMEDSRTNVAFSNSRFQFSEDSGVSIDNSSPTFRACVFSQNQTDGLTLKYSAQPNLGTADEHGNNIFNDNGRYALGNETSKNISAVGNYWGTTVEATIQERIYDKRDDNSLGEVIYRPFLAEADLHPNPPQVLSPADGATVTTTCPLVNWSSVSGAPVYELQVAMEETFTSPIGTFRDLLVTNHQLPSGILTDGQTYFCRVKARTLVGESDWSTPNSFIVNAPSDGETPPITVSDYTVTYPSGLSLVSVPLQPDSSWTLADFVSHIGTDVVQFVIWLDNTSGKFVPYLPSLGETPAAKHPISGGEGYLLSLAESRNVTFRGIAWGAEMPASPKQLVAEGSHQTPLLVICGAVHDEHGRIVDDIQLHIQNKTTGQEVVQISGKDASSGTYIAMLTDFTHNRAGKVGDIIEIRAVAANGQFCSTALQLKLNPEHIRLGHLQIPTLRLLSRPQRTALLQNYPNPFNPETWLPYQLAQSEDVTISIFNLQGRLVRQLRLGHQPAGYYLSQSHAAHWDGRNESGERVASGVYMYQLVTQSFQQIRRLVVVK